LFNEQEIKLKILQYKLLVAIVPAVMPTRHSNGSIMLVIAGKNVKSATFKCCSLQISVMNIRVCKLKIYLDNAFGHDLVDPNHYQ
jgi:hypothetical protein